MTVEQQQTIANEATLEGRGLFMGAAAHVRFRPAPENHGIVFARTDVEPGRTPVRIPALVRHVTKRSRRTTLRVGETSLETCEHCLSALVGLGIDNVLIEVAGPELPGGDGLVEGPGDAVLRDASARLRGRVWRIVCHGWLGGLIDGELTGWPVFLRAAGGNEREDGQERERLVHHVGASVVREHACYAG